MNGKAIFTDAESAQQEADRIFRKDGVRLGVYPCPHCLGWHFTSLSKK